MIRKSTRWDRKERVNVESDLRFLNSLNQYIEISSGSVTSLNNLFSLSFYTDKWNNPLEGNQYIFNTSPTAPNPGIRFFYSAGSTRPLFQIEGLSGRVSVELNVNAEDRDSILNNKIHWAIVLSAFDQVTGFTVDWYWNGKLKESTTVGGATGDFASSFPLRIGANGVNITQAYEGVLSQFMFFNRVLTTQEISYIHTQGGLIPESAHESCVAHYPLTQRQYFKASADFIIKHPQFALNDLIALDVVEQYNYSKLFGSDIGAELTSGLSSQIVSNDGEYYEWTLINGRYFYVGLMDSLTLPRIREEITYSIWFDNHESIRLDSKRNYASSLGTGYFGEYGDTIKFQIDGTALNLYVNNVLDSTLVADTLGVNFYPCVVLSTNTSELSSVNVNGADIKFAQVYKTSAINGTVIKDARLTANHGELINFTDAEAGTDGLAPIGTSIKDFYEKTALDIYDAPVQPLPIDNIETLTQTPPLVNGLDVNGGTVIITGAGTSIGLFIKAESILANLAAIVNGLTSITEYRVNGNLVANETALIDAVNNLELIHINIKATVTNPIIQAFNGHVGLAYIANDNIILKDIYKNINNLLISNPSVNNQQKFNHYYIFNALININEISDLIGASNATTAATVFKDINELR